MPVPPTKKRILLVLCGRGQRHVEPREAVTDDGALTLLAPMTPLACATLAALTPDTYEVDIWDEDLKGQIHASTPLGTYDVVGISLMFTALSYRARFLGLLFQGRGVIVVAGGPAVSVPRPGLPALLRRQSSSMRRSGPGPGFCVTSSRAP